MGKSEYFLESVEVDVNISREIPLPDRHNNQTPCGLFVCDLDGTLLRSDRSFSDTDLDALIRLGELGIIRALATGRSMYSINTVSISDLPVDFILFSSGAGICQHPGGRIIRKVGLEAHEVSLAIRILQANSLDFMVHHPIPGNHFFSYFQSTSDNPDFKKRIALYHQFARPLEKAVDGFGNATQLLAVLPPADSRPVIAALKNALPGFNIIQTTSPLDGQSTWIEIFPATVSKGLTAAWLCAAYGLQADRALSVGNDYNDLDLLEWAGCSFVVDNAPPDLKKRFPAVSSNNENGVAEAVKRWLATGRFTQPQ
jgi:Cof subfamily protein (haloacid dehalogenase superfamily)